MQGGKEELLWAGRVRGRTQEPAVLCTRGRVAAFSLSASARAWRPRTLIIYRVRRNSPKAKLSH